MFQSLTIFPRTPNIDTDGNNIGDKDNKNQQQLSVRGVEQRFQEIEISLQEFNEESVEVNEIMMER